MEQELLIFSEYLTHFCFIVAGCCLTIIFLCSILSNVVVCFFCLFSLGSLFCLSFDELRLLITPFGIFKLILVYHYCWIISILRLPCVCWHDVTVVVVELSPFMLYTSFVVIKCDLHYRKMFEKIHWKILHILLLETTNLIGTKLHIMIFEW